MSLVDQALWYLESHYRESLTSGSVAERLGVSRFHLSRAFRYATGLSPVDYLRRRRLTEGARALVHGHEDILELALSLGYGSHEAFGRAFKDAFQLTPEQMRQRGSLEGLATLEPIFNRSQAMTISLDAQIRDQSSWYVAGLLREHAQMPSPGIPSQWQDFAPFIGSIPGQVGGRT
ncbi:MAG: helix-turn-helix transcriptional regulator [Pseudomonadales bacterium]